MRSTTFDLFNNVESDDSCLVYMGHFDDHFTDILIEVNEAAAELDKKSTLKKVSFLIAECFQNIVRHSDNQDNSDTHQEHPKMFAIRNLDGVYYMSTSNIVHNSKVPDLRQTLDSLNNITKETLKEIYLDSLQNESHNEAGGAGLGLIEMARKSKKAPDYHFEELDDEWSLFFMQIEIIPRRLAGLKEGGNIPLELSQNLYRNLVENDVVLLRKGNLSQKNVLPLFKLIEANMRHDSAGPSIDKKGMYVLIEMLQNIGKHGYHEYDRTEGIITISQRGNLFDISTGNFVETEQVDGMRSKLTELSEMNLAALKRYYKKALFNFDEDSVKGGAGIGLIEMFKIAKEPVEFDFKPVNHKLSFFSLKITI